MKELKEIAKSMETNEMKELATHIDDLASAFETEENVRKAKLPEKVFEEFFLPNLNGDDENNGVALMKYVEYAGGPYNEVDIIDKDGSTLFTCPPLYNRSTGENKSNIPYSEIAGTYELKKARLAAEADNYMHSVAGGINDSITIEESSSEFKWNKIFDRYKENEITDENFITGTTPASTETLSDDMIDYD